MLFPACCLGCGRRLGRTAAILFCPACQDGLVLAAEPWCPGCGRLYRDAAGPSHPCGPCLTGGRHFSAARAVLLYTGPVRAAIHAFKYGGSWAGLATFRHLATRLPEVASWAAADRIVPVPLHVRRLRERGFNQALVLARALFPQARRRIAPDLLERQRPTTPQTALSGAARRANLRGAFRLRPGASVAGQSILLVDDVFTTGTTMSECARVLRRAGAATVWALTLARVDDDDAGPCRQAAARTLP
ncbi:MAG: ComF family protein [Thermodesulfobacteriota bacterium]